MMEEFALYLLKSVIWLSGFALVYLLFLKNERFFAINRFFLISGILSSFLLPLLTIRYSIVLPVVPLVQPENAIVNGIENMTISNTPYTESLLLILYLSGILFVAFMILRQSSSVLHSVKKAEIIASSPVKLIRTSDYTGSFSFFSWVFVNPSVTDIEIREILNHEMVHIRQKHWIDLLLSGLLCMLQWFNPVVWIYVRFIRQNHEYLADEVALQRTSDPAVYRATLLNQIVGSPVVILANLFNYSLNKKRFIMMKNIISSPYRKMKVLLILPVFAIVLYAFAKPEYIYSYPAEKSSKEDPVTTEKSSKEYPVITEKSKKEHLVNTIQAKEVIGYVLNQQEGKPMQGAAIIVSGTTRGTISDENGYFRLEKLPDDFLLVVSYLGFKTKVIKPVFNVEMVVKMIRDTIYVGNSVSNTVPPPPPPPTTDANGSIFKPSTSDNYLKIKSQNGKSPLIVIDGVITDIEVNKIDPVTIESVTVIKDEAAKEKYGEKAKDGVIEIKTKKDGLGGQVETPLYIEVAPTPTDHDNKNIPFVVVEEMPEFQGGKNAMFPWISKNLNYPAEAREQKIEGEVMVRFVINSEGKVGDVVVLKSDNPIFNDEAKRLISSMPDWKPGSQNGKKVNVYYMTPVEFKLQ